MKIRKLSKKFNDNKISEDDFRQFFYDVSTCVENDGDFIQILKAISLTSFDF